MSYYDHATYIALELNSQNKQAHRNGWQLEREFAEQKQVVEQIQQYEKLSLADRARQIYGKLLWLKPRKRGLNSKQI